MPVSHSLKGWILARWLQSLRRAVVNTLLDGRYRNPIKKTLTPSAAGWGPPSELELLTWRAKILQKLGVILWSYSRAPALVPECSEINMYRSTRPQQTCLKAHWGPMSFALLLRNLESHTQFSTRQEILIHSTLQLCEELGDNRCHALGPLICPWFTVQGRNPLITSPGFGFEDRKRAVWNR